MTRRRKNKLANLRNTNQTSKEKKDKNMKVEGENEEKKEEKVESENEEKKEEKVESENEEKKEEKVESENEEKKEEKVEREKEEKMVEIYQMLEEIKKTMNTLNQKVDGLDKKVDSLDHKVGNLVENSLRPFVRNQKGNHFAKPYVIRSLYDLVKMCFNIDELPIGEEKQTFVEEKALAIAKSLYSLNCIDEIASIIETEFGKELRSNNIDIPYLSVDQIPSHMSSLRNRVQKFIQWRSQPIERLLDCNSPAILFLTAYVVFLEEEYSNSVNNQLRRFIHDEVEFDCRGSTRNFFNKMTSIIEVGEMKSLISTKSWTKAVDQLYFRAVLIDTATRLLIGSKKAKSPTCSGYIFCQSQTKNFQKTFPKYRVRMSYIMICEK